LFLLLINNINPLKTYKMAKEEKKKFIKLGEKASSFSCPTTGVSLSGNKVIELTPTLAASKKIKNALRGGHLEYADEKEVTEDLSDTPAMDRTFLEGKTKAVLVPMAISLLTEDDEEDEDDINSMKKADLVDFILLKNEATE